MREELARLDAWVLAKVKRDGPITFMQLQAAGRGAGVLSDFARDYRMLDRSLQRLRKSGEVVYSTKGGWRAVR